MDFWGKRAGWAKAVAIDFLVVILMATTGT